jgi:hypothetical protein
MAEATASPRWLLISVPEQRKSARATNLVRRGQRRVFRYRFWTSK